MTPEERAQKVGEVMWASDSASPWMGMSLDHIEPGAATLSLTVQDHHTNGHKICHGGVMFTLADSAFAFACNSYNRLAVAHVASVTFIAPVKIGAVLTARAKMLQRRGRNGICDVEVSDSAGEIVAQFRGHSREIGGQHFEEETGNA